MAGARFAAPTLGRILDPSSSAVADDEVADDQEATMSKLARACIVGAMLAAINLAGMTAVAQAQANDEPASRQGARRPPTEGQVGESWRHRQVASDEPTSTLDARRPPLESRVGESYRHGARVSQEQTNAVRPAEPSGQPGWLILGLGVSAAALTLVAALAVMAAKRAHRKVPTGQAG
jgi:hypothetical protein